MATQRYISTSFWTDKWIRDLDPSERYLYMYFLTNPQTNIAGIYQITLDRMAFDTGYDERTLRPMIDRFAKAKKAYFIEDEWIILPSWPKHQKVTENNNIRVGIDTILKSVPDKVWSFIKKIEYQYAYIDNINRGSKGLEDPYKPLDRVLNYINTDTDTDTDIDTKKPKNKKPTLEEVKQYFKEQNTIIDPEAFFYHYETNGWVQGKNKPIKDWKSCLKTWEAREKKDRPKETKIKHCTKCGASLYNGICSNVLCENYRRENV